MNLIEYIDKRLLDVKYYLRGINYNKTNSENIVKGLNEKMNYIFNQHPLYRTETNKFALEIKNQYDLLVATKLEFATTKQEVDKSILEFETTIKEIMINFKNNILRIMQKNSNYNSNTINHDMSFINIRIRNKDDKKTRDELHQVNELDGIRDCFCCIYTFIYMIMDKYDKLEEFLNWVNEAYHVTEKEYTNYLGIYTKLINERNYDRFIKIYNDTVIKLSNNKKIRKNT